MNLLAFLLALAAIVAFCMEFARTRGYASLGLAVLTAAWIVELVVRNGTVVHIG